ncbi:hypothetical protein HAX54_038667 [Datura stramonium]|uniref:Uncharacterized protein n=1 Tax=Datura stramonium TaxID=4076 RepID=A0ABS8VP32_DATST|nr:hypothetical protein [Datura stramonium]
MSVRQEDFFSRTAVRLHSPPKPDKEAPSYEAVKKYNMTPPPPAASAPLQQAQLMARVHNSPPHDLLNIAKRAKMHENQLVRLAKAIPSMIQSAIKKALQPAKDKLTSLCSTVDVLESKVGTLIQEVGATPNTSIH